MTNKVELTKQEMAVITAMRDTNPYKARVTCPKDESIQVKTDHVMTLIVNVMKVVVDTSVEAYDEWMIKTGLGQGKDFHLFMNDHVKYVGDCRGSIEEIEQCPQAYEYMCEILSKELYSRIQFDYNFNDDEIYDLTKMVRGELVG